MANTTRTNSLHQQQTQRHDGHAGHEAEEAVVAFAVGAAGGQLSRDRLPPLDSAVGWYVQ